MWETPAGPASSKERCEEWDSFTVPYFARFRISTVLAVRHVVSASVMLDE